jgi:hypothetical protein
MASHAYAYEAEPGRLYRVTTDVQEFRLIAVEKRMKDAGLEMNDFLFCVATRVFVTRRGIFTNLHPFTRLTSEAAYS